MTVGWFCFPKWVCYKPTKTNDRESITCSYTHTFSTLYKSKFVGEKNPAMFFQEYIEMVLPMHCRARVSIEAGTDHSWGRFIGIDSWLESWKGKT